MKERNGFVSNSSTSSFIISKKAMDEEKKNKLLEMIKSNNAPYSKPRFYEADTYYRVAQWIGIDLEITNFIEENFPKEEIETTHGGMGYDPIPLQKETRII